MKKPFRPIWEGNFSSSTYLLGMILQVVVQFEAFACSGCPPSNMYRFYVITPESYRLFDPFGVP